MSLEKQFPGKDIVYTLVEPECDEDGFTGVETLLYIGTDFDKSRDISNINLECVAELRHRVYVDSELMLEAVIAYGATQWKITFDLIKKLEAELEEAKNRLVEATAKLVALGQR